MHTTTFSEIYELVESQNGTEPVESKGRIIDTPGIKGFGTIDFEREEVGHFFPEIFRASAECRFGNCTHTNEPGCAVIEAVEHGEIALSRYESYLSILGDCSESKYR
jgi:ribosome biogenesis GTPase